MADKPIKGKQIDALSKIPKELEQISFNLDKQDDFIQSHGVTFVHYRAMPSPIGLRDRGDYRRSNGLDTISENGFIYEKCGTFRGVVLNNNKDKKPVDGGLFDSSQARLTLPRFYDKDSEEMANERIHLCPGDRIYLYKLDKDDRDVVNYQMVNYNPNGTDYLQFPATCVESIIDSQGEKYKEGVHFKITKSKDNFGNIKWLDGKKSPGTDPATGKGRVYSIRYRYEAHWYISAILNELRIGRTTEGSVRKETRMPYQVMIQREYVYHNRTRGDNEEGIETDRTNPEDIQSVNPNSTKIKVNVSNFE